MSIIIKPELIINTDENMDDYKDPGIEGSFEVVEINSQFPKEKQQIETNRLQTQSDEHQTFIKTRKYRSSQELQLRQPRFVQEKPSSYSKNVKTKSIMVYYLVKRFLTKLSVARKHRLFFKHKHFEIVGDKASGYEQSLGELSKMSKQYKKRGKSKNIFQIALNFLIHFASCIENVFRQIPIVYPQSIHKIIWDISFCFVLIYFFVMIPIELAFNQGLMYDGCIWITIPFTFFLIVDYFMKMNTVYYEYGQAIIDKSQLFNNYLKNGFLVDGISICVIIFNYFNYYYFQTQWISLLLVFFVTQVHYFAKIIRNVEESRNLDKTSASYLNLVKLLLTILYILHVYSCLWFFIGSYGHDRDWSNWLDTYDLKDNLAVSQYLNAFYFSTVTMISVGYGDIVPQNELEKICTILFMMTTCIQLSFTVNTVGQIFSSINLSTESTSEKIRIINKYMNKKNISFYLQYQIREYIKIYCSQQMKEENDQEEKLISSLSENLKNKLIQEANQSILDQCNLIKTAFTDQTKQKLIKLLKTVFISPEQIITSQLSQFNEPCLCFIESGELLLFNNNHNEQSDLIKFSKGQYFGLEELLTGQLPTLQLQSESFVQLSILLRSEFLDVLKEIPIDYETFCSLKDQILMQHFSIQSKCISCNCSGHTIQNCPVVHFVADKERVIKSYQFDRIQKRLYVIRNKNRGRNMFHSVLDQWFLSEMSNMFRSHGEWPIVQFYALSNKILEQPAEKVESPIVKLKEIQNNRSDSQLPQLYDLVQMQKFDLQQNPCKLISQLVPQNKTMRSNFKRLSIRVKNSNVRLKFQKIVKKIIRLRHFSSGFQKSKSNALLPHQIFNQGIYWVVTSYFQQPQLEEYLCKEDFENLQFLFKRLNLTINKDLDISKLFDCSKEYQYYLKHNNISWVIQSRDYYRRKSNVHENSLLIRYLSFPNEYYEKFHKKQVQSSTDKECLRERKTELIKRFSNKRSLRRSNNVLEFQKSIKSFNKMNRVIPSDFCIDTP